ncbi:MAG: hypothetical protein OSA84_12385, partial [Akkermansiaceae bacterium]|nr:hypothetical protein [Akkermansiaceae bacterium]
RGSINGLKKNRNQDCEKVQSIDTTEIQPRINANVREFFFNQDLGTEFHRKYSLIQANGYQATFDSRKFAFIRG